MKLPPEEPEFGPWQAVSVQSLLTSWKDNLPPPGERPGVVAVDGRGAGGKSTAAAVLSSAVPGSVVVHTDDIAWHHTFFDWADLAREGILMPTHAGRHVHYRPPVWEQRNREGAIEVPQGTSLLILEGCGAAREELMPWIDVVVWVQTDIERAKARGLVRDGGTPEAEAFWDEWMAEEFPFYAKDRPWDRADVVVSGMPDLEYDAATQLVVAQKPQSVAAPSSTFTE